MLHEILKEPTFSIQQQNQKMKTGRGYIHRCDGIHPIEANKINYQEIGQLDDLICHCFKSGMNSKETLNVIKELDMMIFPKSSMYKRIYKARDMINGFTSDARNKIPSDKLSKVDSITFKGLMEGKTANQIIDDLTNAGLNFLTMAGNHSRIYKMRRDITKAKECKK